MPFPRPGCITIYLPPPPGEIVPSCPRARPFRLHQRDWPVVYKAPFEHVHRHADGGDGEENKNAPIEGGKLNRCGAGPKAPEKDEDGVEESSGVDDGAEATQAPAGVGEQFRVLEAAQKHAADGGGIGEHQGRQLQRDDGIEGGGAAKVDQGERNGHAGGQGHGVGGDLEFGVNLNRSATGRAWHVRFGVGRGKGGGEGGCLRVKSRKKTEALYLAQTQRLGGRRRR